MAVDLANDVHAARQIKPGTCRVETQVQMADADGAVLCGVDLNEAISMYTTVSWHSCILPLGNHSVYTAIWWLSGCTVRRQWALLHRAAHSCCGYSEEMGSRAEIHWHDSQTEPRDGSS